ncbi:MAG: DinB family protein [Actinobacteria bacterium]|nr:DinB family protein [Actinomycetota bacterium]
MTPVRRRPPFVADERTQLVGWLDLQRAIVHMKCEGLSDADARRSVLPGSPLTTMADGVSHLRWIEHCWFEVVFLGRPAAGPRFDDGPEDAAMMASGQPLEALLADYERQCARSNEIAAAHSLDAVGKHPGFRAAAATLRWILIHLVEETARHAGRMDAIRGLLDEQRRYH